MITINPTRLFNDRVEVDGAAALIPERYEINGNDSGEKQKWNLMSYFNKGHYNHTGRFDFNHCYS